MLPQIIHTTHEETQYLHIKLKAKSSTTKYVCIFLLLGDKSLDSRYEIPFPFYVSNVTADVQARRAIHTYTQILFITITSNCPHLRHYFCFSHVPSCVTACWKTEPFGPCVTVIIETDVTKCSLIATWYELLNYACRIIPSVQLRNRIFYDKNSVKSLEQLHLFIVQ